jgi:hypothetical protein
LTSWPPLSRISIQDKEKHRRSLLRMFSFSSELPTTLSSTSSVSLGLITLSLLTFASKRHLFLSFHHLINLLCCFHLSWALASASELALVISSLPSPSHHHSSLSIFSRYDDKRRAWVTSKLLCRCFKAQFEHAINCVWAIQALCTPLWRCFLFPQLRYLKPRLRRFSRSWITIILFPGISEWSWLQAKSPLHCCTWSKWSNCFPPSHHLMLSFPFSHHFNSLTGVNLRNFR